MKKITFLIFSIILLCFINNCAGYKPIYSSSNLSFKIEDYSIKGEKRLANLIYRKLNNISLSNKNNLDVQSIALFIETIKEKKPTVKNNRSTLKSILDTPKFLKKFPVAFVETVRIVLNSLVFLLFHPRHYLP